MGNPHEDEVAESIRSLLASFESGETSLGQLVTQLEGVPDLLKGLGAPWCNRFRQSWESLEEVYAHMLDRGIPTPVPPYDSLTRDAVSAIRELIGTIPSSNERVGA